METIENIRKQYLILRVGSVCYGIVSIIAIAIMTWLAIDNTQAQAGDDEFERIALSEELATLSMNKADVLKYTESQIQEMVDELPDTVAAQLPKDFTKKFIKLFNAEGLDELYNRTICQQAVVYSSEELRILLKMRKAHPWMARKEAIMLDNYVRLSNKISKRLAEKVVLK